MKFFNWIKENRILLLIVLIGAILRFYKLDYQSLWIDELFSMNIADPKNNFQFIYTFLRDYDPHPPLYYFLIHLFFLILGYSTLVLKIFSALMGVLGIFSIYYLGKEVANKNVGLIASFLTSINYFHIYYSQEGRMYTLLFFTTCIALYTLVKFTKKTNYQTLLYFVIGSLLMIYSHFFGVFVLVSFYIILFINILKSNPEERLRRLKFSIISGLLTIVLYIPSIIIVVMNPKRETIWIQSPNFETFKTMFKEFFGYNSTLTSILLIVVVISIFTFFFYKNTIKRKDIKSYADHPIFVLLLVMILSIIIPLIYSKLALPIIVSRYYIGVLACILILFAISIESFKNKYLKICVILIFAVFSVKNLFLEKKIYTTFYKTQFKHAVTHITQENPNDIIVSKLGNFYLKFYLNKNNYYKDVIEKDINGYIASIKNDTLSLQDFYYFEGHIPTYTPTDETVEFLNKHYFMDDNVELFDSYIKHFVLKKDYKPRVAIDEFNFSKEKNGDEINHYVESFEEHNGKVNISGWAYFLGQSAENTKIQILLIKDLDYQVVLTDNIRREDVTTYFKSQLDLSNSGFRVSIDKNTLKEGNYKVAIFMIDKVNKKKSMVITDKFFSAN